MPKYKLIAVDLDGTIAQSKLPITPQMAEYICAMIRGEYKVAVISGAAYERFITQVVSKLPCAIKQMPMGVCADECLKNLLLLPQNGSELHVNDGTWKTVYKDALSKELVEEINSALEKVLTEESAIIEKKDSQIENRGSQISFSALGQNADLEIKKTWDPDAKKRTIIADKLRTLLPDCEVTVAGTTTIDVTRKGVNKAYAIERIKKYLGISDGDILFFGDAIFPGGNDEPVAKLGIESIKVSGPEDTGNHFAELLAPRT